MPSKINYHIHTKYSDGRNYMAEICKEAIKLGLEEIAFTEHFILSKLEPPLEHQFDMIQILINRFPLKIKFGVEMDYFEGHESELKRIIANNPFDFVMGSAHYLDDLNILNRGEIDRYLNNHNLEELYLNYFEHLHRAIESGLFDIMAHMDVVRWWHGKMINNKIFEKLPFNSYKKQAEEIVKALKETNTGFEYNTFGYSPKFYLKDGCPSIELLQMCKDAGIEKITLGSDCHSIDRLTADLDKGLEQLRGVGYEKICLFEKRKPSFINIKDIE